MYALSSTVELIALSQALSNMNYYLKQTLLSHPIRLRLLAFAIVSEHTNIEVSKCIPINICA